MTTVYLIIRGNEIDRIYCDGSNLNIVKVDMDLFENGEPLDDCVTFCDHAALKNAPPGPAALIRYAVRRLELPDIGKKETS